MPLVQSSLLSLLLHYCAMHFPPFLLSHRHSTHHVMAIRNTNLSFQHMMRKNVILFTFFDDPDDQAGRHTAAQK